MISAEFHAKYGGYGLAFNDVLNVIIWAKNRPEEYWKQKRAEYLEDLQNLEDAEEREFLQNKIR